MDVNDEWDQFLEGDGEQIQSNNSDKADIENNNVCEDLYISTKTKVLYLNQDINIQELFLAHTYS